MLTDKELIFCEIYAKTLNYSRALKEAGYTNKNVTQAKNRLLEKQEINDYIAEKIREKTSSYANEDTVWHTLTNMLDHKTTVTKVFIVDKTIVEKQVPIEPLVKLKACDMLAKLLGMYDRAGEDNDNAEYVD